MPGCIVPTLCLAFLAMVGMHELGHFLWGWLHHPVLRLAEYVAGLACLVFVARFVWELEPTLVDRVKAKLTKKP